MNRLDDSVEIHKMDAQARDSIDITQARETPELDRTFDETNEPDSGCKEGPEQRGPGEMVDDRADKGGLEVPESKPPAENLNITMDLLSDENCMICLENIYKDPAIGDLGKKSEDFFENSMFKTLSKKYCKSHRMKTPCNHFFHTSRVALGVIRRVSAQVDGGQNGVPILPKRFAGDLLAK